MSRVSDSRKLQAQQASSQCARDALVSFGAARCQQCAWLAIHRFTWSDDVITTGTSYWL